MRQIIIFSSILLVLGVSCNRKSASKVASTPLSHNALISTLSVTPYQTLKARASISVNAPDLKQSGMATIQMIKNKKALISITKFGLLVAQVLINNDSIYMVNHFANEYTAQSLQSFLIRYNIAGNFQTVERIILGMVPLSQCNCTPEITSDSTIVLKGIYLPPQDSLIYVFNSSLPSLNSLFYKRTDKDYINIVQSEFQKLTSFQPYFSMNRVIKAQQNDEHYFLDLKFSQVAFDEPLNIAFEIPKKYTKID